jgi:hypothetical protein
MNRHRDKRAGVAARRADIATTRADIAARRADFATNGLTSLPGEPTLRPDEPTLPPMSRSRGATSRLRGRREGTVAPPPRIAPNESASQPDQQALGANKKTLPQHRVTFAENGETSRQQGLAGSRILLVRRDAGSFDAK